MPIALSWRGRIGRGSHRSYCLLLDTSKTAEAKVRLEVLEKSTEGFFISEMDLRLRGPGVVMGYRQSGISEFALANILEVIRSASHCKWVGARYIAYSGLKNCKKC